MPYRLLAEACIPTINTDDIGSIFEEHRICRSLATSGPVSRQLLESSSGDGGVYGEEERRFLFNTVLVGSKAKARFRINNTKKVPCDVAFSVKPVGAGKGVKSDVFEVTPGKAQISANGYLYAVVTFGPAAMQVVAGLWF